MSIRRAASCGQPLQLNSFPRAARTSRALMPPDDRSTDAAPGFIPRYGNSTSASGYARRMGGTIRVLVVDDEAVVRDALADVVASDGEFELVGAARDADEAIALAEATRPDVALVDVRMPGGGGFRVAEQLRSRAPETRVLAHSAVDDRTTVIRMLREGAVGYLVKGTSPAEILAAIRRAARGQPSLSPDVMTGIVKELGDQLQREEAATSERLARVERIRRLIAGHGRTIVYQPIVRLDGRAVVGMEALSRFETDEVRPVDQWFLEAGSLGLGSELEMAAVRSALDDLPALPASSFLSVNASFRTAESETFLEALASVDGSRVVVEITEHEQVDDYDRLAGSLQRLRAEGARIAIDDAGAGFASLRHILLIEPEIIKLDVSLTSGIDADPRRRALAAALISFADELRMTVVAEGIETESEEAALQALGVHFGQGYFIGRPAMLDGELRAS